MLNVYGLAGFVIRLRGQGSLKGRRRLDGEFQIPKSATKRLDWTGQPLLVTRLGTTLRDKRPCQVYETKGPSR
jgi:hypothetical protein